MVSNTLIIFLAILVSCLYVVREIIHYKEVECADESTT